METIHTIHREISLSAIQGISVELRHVVPESWMMTTESDSFVVRGELGEGVEDHLWRVVRFVAYPAFLTLQRTRKSADEVRYEMVSANAAGRGFRVEFILTPGRSR